MRNVYIRRSSFCVYMKKQNFCYFPHTDKFTAGETIELQSAAAAVSLSYPHTLSPLKRHNILPPTRSKALLLLLRNSPGASLEQRKEEEEDVTPGSLFKGVSGKISSSRAKKKQKMFNLTYYCNLHLATLKLLKLHNCWPLTWYMTIYFPANYPLPHCKATFQYSFGKNLLRNLFVGRTRVKKFI